MVQPPSGGCVLKLRCDIIAEYVALPAAFGRLCVETRRKPMKRALKSAQPPSGGCVLKRFVVGLTFKVYRQPPSGGCVLKLLAY